MTNRKWLWRRQQALINECVYDQAERGAMSHEEALKYMDEMFSIKDPKDEIRLATVNGCIEAGYKLLPE